jgi:homoserine O-acetyltransferase
VAYETWGTLNEAKTNAVLICHALSGDAHVAGYRQGEDPDDPNHKPGWWDLYVGPGKPIDTDRYFVICSNVLGGCKGTTGPGSTNPQTGKPYGLDFPVVTISDMVETQRHLIDHLGIERLLAVVGGSMGGMQVLDWAVRYPDRVLGAIPIATTASLSAQSLAFDAVGRNAIRSDPAFSDGRYIETDTQPTRGLAIARMLGHITYLSEEGMARKFGRTLRHRDEKAYDLGSEFSVETYLDYQGRKFVDRFDANSYLYITRAMDYFDLGEKHGGVSAALAQAKARFLVISFTSDWLFPPAQSQQLVGELGRLDHAVSYINIESDYGHDTFLLECEPQARALAGFLRRLSYEADDQASPLSGQEILTEEADEKRRLDLERIVTLFSITNSRVLDLGCGDGMFLHYLKARGCPRVQGVDVDCDKVVRCIERGVDAVQADLDQPLDMFADRSFDNVLLSRTLQVVRDPTVVMREMLRIGWRGIVTFPNFAYWRNRHYITWFGRVPVSRNLPFSWIDTPNLHHLSLCDFEDWCRQAGVRIEQRIAMDYASDQEIRWMANLRATDAIYVISNSPED